MTELEISIGGRSFSVACDNEEQEKVRQAAALINEEADAIQTQLGRLPESKMLLLSALMIADRLADLESESTVLKEKSEDLLNLKNKNKQLEQQKSALEVDCQNLEYKRCNTACSTPPTYKSTGIQYFSSSLSHAKSSL